MGSEKQQMRCKEGGAEGWREDKVILRMKGGGMPLDLGVFLSQHYLNLKANPHITRAAADRTIHTSPTLIMALWRGQHSPFS